ncbi:enoyl-CoA hydratase/isomerase family protein [Reinekea blandensis]|uniref:3-hydroxyisobutyryl-CoA hydrolase n=1 Tax=Reinekea blandensis MED297 TaxID=314283 RepID=A4BIL5_9GAMM|nr:enoyl-CoA hydratase/isomerase family protein [Reinekea blandensis]EAR07979.1 probable enoyl-CoA hydratase/isomerase [Reinekea sp. MED297] [Reinekea blandensis MED297]
MNAPYIQQETEGVLRIIRLDRPKALNALSLEMLTQLEHALNDALADDAIEAVWLESASERAFCAGGDVKALALAVDEQTDNAQKQALARTYFELEYRIDLQIEHYEKPLVVFANGLVMGGGWGLYAGAQLKLCTERAVFAMPENQIGFYPDVGAAEFLQRPDWKQGTFLALSGMTLSAVEAVALNYVDAIVEEDYARVLKQSLSQGLSLTDLDLETADTSIDECAQQWRTALSRLPDNATLTDWINLVEQNAGEYDCFMRTEQMWQSASPWSLALTWEYFRQMRGASRREVLTADTEMGARLSTHPDFYAGVHAKLINKNNEPEWHYPHTESVPLEDVLEVLNVDSDRK